MNIHTQKLNENAAIPSFQSVGAAAVDLVASHDANLFTGMTALVKTGLAMEIPPGYVGLVCSRSGLSTKGIFVLNAPGVIDSDYRGDITVILHNLGPDGQYIVKQGDRVAQLMIIKMETPNFVKAISLDGTARNISGFGSTGV